MSESLQQKVDRMTVGMAVTVTFGGDEPGTVSGPITRGQHGERLLVAGRIVRLASGEAPGATTAIDMRGGA